MEPHFNSQSLNTNKPWGIFSSVESDRSSRLSRRYTRALNSQVFLEENERPNEFKVENILPSPDPRLNKGKIHRKLTYADEETLDSVPSNSWNSLGPTPCTMFCQFCKSYVHTCIAPRSQNKLGGLFQKFFSCCQSSLFESVHKCSSCGAVLGSIH